MKSKGIVARLVLAVAMVGLLLEPGALRPEQAEAATYTVSNTADSGSGSLREAMMSAMAGSGGDTISITATGTISLLSALPTITKPLTITGPGMLSLTVARSTDAGTPNFRIFHVENATGVSITDLTVSNGRDTNAVTGQGGGIRTYNSTVTLERVTVTNNQANWLGGGIFNTRGTLTIADSSVTGNTIGDWGGGIANHAGTLYVNHTTVSDNTAGVGGGGIANFTWGDGNATLTVQSSSTISGNHASRSDADSEGGGIASRASNGKTASVTVSRSTLSRNTAGNSTQTGRGGGILNQAECQADGPATATLTVTDANINVNTASGAAGEGGGIHNRACSTIPSGGSILVTSTANLTISSGYVSGNSAGNGGGIWNGVQGIVSLAGSPYVMGNTATSMGGGIFNSGSGSLTTNRVNLYTNSASYGGGAYLDNTATSSLTNLNVRGNSALADGGGILVTGSGAVPLTNVAFGGNKALGNGGGMASLASTPSLVNTTFSGNWASSGGGIYASGSSPTIVNSILWGELSGGEISGTANVTYSLVQGVTNNDANHVYGNRDPLFVDPVHTVPPVPNNSGDLRQKPGSPAIDAGNNAAYLSSVDRELSGQNRFLDDPGTPDTGSGTAPIVDMGAYEFNGTSPRPDLTISKTHTGDFTQGQTGAQYTITAANASTTAATSGVVEVKDTLPSGLTPTAVGGQGWFCELGTLTCARSDALAASSSYPAITLTVNVAAGAPASVTNMATVSGGGEINTANNTANDSTAINPSGGDAIAPTSSISFPANGTTYTITPWKAGCATASDGDICGTASDNTGGSGVQNVQVSIKRSSDNTYWNGSAFSGTTETWNNASSADSWAHWKYPFTPPTDTSYTVRSKATDAASNVETPGTGVTFTFAAAKTSMLYTGQQIVVMPGALNPVSATLSSPDTFCKSSMSVKFYLDKNPTTGAAGPFPLTGSPVNTNSSGVATLGSLSTSGWQEGVYTLTAEFLGYPTTDSSVCAGSKDEVTLTVGSTGDAATGGGNYNLSGRGRINFGFTVKKVDPTCTTGCEYKGQFLLINNEKWRLKGELNSFTQTGTTVPIKGASNGSGQLFKWNGTSGTWDSYQTNVPFTISFVDGGEPGKGGASSNPDDFGIQIKTSVAESLPPLPNSQPVDLKGGNISIKTGGDGGTNPPKPRR